MKFSQFLANEGFFDDVGAAVKGSIKGAKQAVQQNRQSQQTQQAYKALEQAVQQLINAGFSPENVNKQIQTITSRLTTPQQTQQIQQFNPNQRVQFDRNEKVVLDPERNIFVSRQEIEKRKQELLKKYQKPAANTPPTTKTPPTTNTTNHANYTGFF